MRGGEFPPPEALPLSRIQAGGDPAASRVTRPGRRWTKQIGGTGREIRAALVADVARRATRVARVAEHPLSERRVFWARVVIAVWALFFLLFIAVAVLKRLWFVPVPLLILPFNSRGNQCTPGRSWGFRQPNSDRCRPERLGSGKLSFRLRPPRSRRHRTSPRLLCRHSPHTRRTRCRPRPGHPASARSPACA